MAAEIIAYCGLVCSECEAYIATQNNDMEALKQLAAKWTQEFGGTVTVEGCTCDGCLGATGRKGGYCGACPVRACAVERGVVNCAHCPDYGCEKITQFFTMAPAAQAKLDAIRASL